eukprot:scaffold5684_cov169-Amphora_coffeaeformis.AAC.11
MKDRLTGAITIPEEAKQDVADEKSDETATTKINDEGNSNTITSSSYPKESQHQAPIIFVWEQDSALRNMALWRMIFFSIMMYEWSHDQVLTPFGSFLDLETDIAQNKPGKDRWFSYNQFEWIQDLHQWLGGKDTNIAWNLQQGGLVLLGLAAFGIELSIPGWRWYTSLITALYLIRFLAKATNFTNHNYLFPLLMILTTFSGGGNLFSRTSKRDDDSNNSTRTKSQRSCQAAIVALRGQLAIMYVFASIWKIHPDWFTGRIVRRIFLSFQMSNKARGIPWDAVEQASPQVFVALAAGGFLLDAGMATVLCFGTPTPASTRLFSTFTFMFHLATSLTMAQMIGYAFPATCISGLVLFLPLSVVQEGDDGTAVVAYDKSLVSWLYHYATTCWSRSGMESSSYSGGNSLPPPIVAPRRWQKDFVLSWIIWQLFMPLRMIVISGGNFAYNRLGYRYSWTMMLHDNDYGIIRKSEEVGGHDLVLLLSYYVPTCFLRGGEPDMFMPRSLYLGPHSGHSMQDSRTVPMHQILGARESAMLEVFPTHLIHRVGAGVAQAIDGMVGGGACGQIQGKPPSVLPLDPRMGMHAVYLGRLNGNGPYSRLIDPTIDLVAVMEDQRNQKYSTTLWKSFLDERPDGKEYVLRHGIGSMRQAAKNYEAELKLHFPDSTVEFLADRASCLHARPLWLTPMGVSYGFIPLRLPYGTSLALHHSDQRVGPSIYSKELHLGKLGVITSTALEIDVTGLNPTIVNPCGETYTEDVLIAVIY